MTINEGKALLNEHVYTGKKTLILKEDSDRIKRQAVVLLEKLRDLEILEHLDVSDEEVKITLNSKSIEERSVYIFINLHGMFFIDREYLVRGPSIPLSYMIYEYLLYWLCGFKKNYVIENVTFEYNIYKKELIASRHHAPEEIRNNYAKVITSQPLTINGEEYYFKDIELKANTDDLRIRISNIKLKPFRSEKVWLNQYST